MDAVVLRCAGRRFGDVLGATSGTLEVACDHPACAQRRTVALHTFDLVTGILKDTRTFRKP